MPLTPEDVSNKRFTPVRLREGYDMGEVDQFLDEVEAELARLTKENDDLRNKLSAAQTSGGAAGFEPQATQQAPAVQEAEPEPEPQPEPEPEQVVAAAAAVAAPEPVAPAPQETIKVVTAAEASSAALRLLELATKNADEVVAEAKQEAEGIVGSARTEAERLQAETKAAADALEAEARTRAQNLDQETDAKRSELLGDMEKEKARLDGEVENLRAFEREYRSRLKSYFTEQLQALEGSGEGGQLPNSGDSTAPKRLKSVSDEGPDQQGGNQDPNQGNQGNQDQNEGGDKPQG